MRNIRAKLTITLILSLIPFQDLLAWEGYNSDKDESFDVITYDHKGKGEGPVEYKDENGNLHTGYLDMFPGGSGELTDDDTGETYEVEMSR